MNSNPTRIVPTSFFIISNIAHDLPLESTSSNTQFLYNPSFQRVRSLFLFFALSPIHQHPSFPPTAPASPSQPIAPA